SSHPGFCPWTPGNEDRAGKVYSNFLKRDCHPRPIVWWGVWVTAKPPDRETHTEDFYRAQKFEYLLEPKRLLPEIQNPIFYQGACPRRFSIFSTPSGHPPDPLLMKKRGSPNHQPSLLIVEGEGQRILG
ncbi:MAG: hypothetical protein PHQ81_11515, partial [Methanofollis sp.]|nr:hypothetical protein [Methanofollis sp.]